MKRLSSPHSSWVHLSRWLVRLLAVQRIAASRVGISSVVLGVGVTLLASGLAPSVQAYTTEDLETVYRVEGEDYNAIVRRAEIVARASAQQKFDSDILLTRVVITVLGQNGGQTAPILVLDVNRNDWRNRPDPQYWATYYRSTRVLLEMDGGSAPIQTTPPRPRPSPPPTENPGRTPSNSPSTPNNSAPTPNRSTAPSSSTEDLLPSGANSPPSINIPATPSGQIGLPRSILR